MEVDFIFAIVVLIMSVVIHEVSHGFTAYYFGDPTAKLANRLTLNPLKHLDPIGSIVVPVIAYLSTGFIFGWAKPVPYNPYNLKNAKYAEPLVALAGAMSNFLVAIVFGLLIRFGVLTGSLVYAGSLIVFVNIILGVFNLIPIPPLDGSKVLFGILPFKFMKVREFLEKNWIWLILILIFFLPQIITPIVSVLFTFITGMSF